MPGRFHGSVLFDVPEGFVVDKVRVRNNLNFNQPTSRLYFSRPTDWMFPGSVLDEGTDLEPLRCTAGGSSENISWEYPGTVLDADGRFTFDFNVESDCTFQLTQETMTLFDDRLAVFDEEHGTLVGPIVFEADIRPAAEMLVVTAADMGIPTRIPQTAMFPVEEHDTEVTAVAMVAGQVGDPVTIDLEISDFDPIPGGHVGHPTVPGSVVRNGVTGPETRFGRGRLLEQGSDPDPDGDVLTASCTATLQENPDPEGLPLAECKVTYEAGIVAGNATVRGTIAGTAVEGETDILIGMPMQAAQAFFTRPNELVVSSLATHPGPFFADAEVMPFIVDFQREFERRTTTITPEHPQGVYSSFNDMSLQLGGLFDLQATWLNVHNSHRLGTSLDINRSILMDVETQQRLDAMPVGLAEGHTLEPNPAEDPQLPFDQVRISRRGFNAICEQSGGFALVEAGLHCEWRGQF